MPNLASLGTRALELLEFAARVPSAFQILKAAMSADRRKPVLILGAGINGCAVARELLLNGIHVCIVEANDIAWGATSRSSRLIHGGLRYLEYGDFRLVRESLAERTRLRKLAPQFVEPLQLYIPVRRRFAGLLRSILRFLGVERLLPLRNGSERGLWLVRLGLWFYDRLAWGRDFPKHRVAPIGSPDAPAVDGAYRWLCGYYDAQMQYPERFVIALLEDARRLAAEQGAEFQVWTYHRVVLNGAKARVERRSDMRVTAEFEPSMIINATGAWGDLTLAGLGLSMSPLFGGTKGSHIVSFMPRLKAALGNDGVYAETSDGRLVFILPFGEGVLVGTTDERFSEPPDFAIATEREIEYLIAMVNHLFPQLGFSRGDVDMHYAGVRPLPSSRAHKVASITRDHAIEVHLAGPITVWTLVGGKLTTARAFAEQVAERVCAHLRLEHRANSRERPVPGGEKYPPDADAVAAECARLAENSGLQVTTVQAMWSLCGNRVREFLQTMPRPTNKLLPGTELPVDFVRWVIDHEWPTTIGDLIERRLMLLYQPSLSAGAVRRLAQCLSEAGLLDPPQIEDAVSAEINRLEKYFGKSVTE